MLHYPALLALATVAEEGSFGRAARRLHITQPAISLRIRQLEESTGAPLLKRGVPLQLTERGVQLVQHLREVCRMEGELGIGDSEEEPGAAPATMTISINADSLATWIFDALTPYIKAHAVRLEVLVEDEDYAFELLRSGTVSGAVSSASRSQPGCDLTLLGALEYYCVASARFQSRRITKPPSPELLAELPSMSFGRKDDLQETFLEQQLRLRAPKLNRHMIGSNQAYLQAVLEGWGWGLVPHIQALPLIKKGRLRVLRQERISVKLYWHQWRASSALLRGLSGAVVQTAQKVLISAK